MDPLVYTPVTKAERSCPHEEPYCTVDCAVCQYLRRDSHLAANHAQWMTDPVYVKAWNRLLHSRKLKARWDRILAVGLRVCSFFFWYFVGSLTLTAWLIVSTGYRPRILNILMDGGFILIFYLQEKWGREQLERRKDD